MYDDLPATMLAMRKGTVYEVKISAGRQILKKYSEYSDSIPSLMKKMLEKCEGRELMLNQGALAHLRNSMGALKRGGHIDIYDYGYADAEEALEEPAEVWNAGTVREYGGQLTVDVNFALLADEARKRGLRARMERVSERLERRFGRKFKFVDLRTGGRSWVGYLDEKGLKAKAGVLRKAGYSREFISGEVREDDAYLHLRVEK